MADKIVETRTERIVEDKKSITMLTDQVGADGKALKKGGTYSLGAASADHWLKRGHATASDDGSESNQEDAGDDQDDGSDTMTVAQLKEALDAKGIAHPSRASKSELQELLDGAQ